MPTSTCRCRNECAPTQKLAPMSCLASARRPPAASSTAGPGTSSPRRKRCPVPETLREYKPVPAEVAKGLAMQFDKATVVIVAYDAGHDRYSVVRHGDDADKYGMLSCYVRKSEEDEA